MYEELVKRLRELQAITKHCDEQSCDECENRKLCDKHDNKTLSGTYKEAADAIEELVRKEKFHTFLWNVINPNEMEQYIAMYNSRGIPVCGFPEPPKEE